MKISKQNKQKTKITAAGVLWDILETEVFNYS